MEEIMNKMMKNKQKQETCSQTTTSSSLSLHKDSRIISKVKPKIRIIHIFAPEIIKTDADNFRELVQRLTGKPAADDQKDITYKFKKPTRQQNGHHVQDQTAVMTKKVEMRSGFGNGLGHREKMVKEEEAMWNGSNSGGFLTGFADLDGFIQELGGFPMEVNLMQGFDESQLKLI